MGGAGPLQPFLSGFWSVGWEPGTVTVICPSANDWPTAGAQTPTHQTRRERSALIRAGLDVVEAFDTTSNATVANFEPHLDSRVKLACYRTLTRVAMCPAA